MSQLEPLPCGERTAEKFGLCDPVLVEQPHAPPPESLPARFRPRADIDQPRASGQGCPVLRHAARTVENHQVRSFLRDAGIDSRRGASRRIVHQRHGIWRAGRIRRIPMQYETNGASRPASSQACCDRQRPVEFACTAGAGHWDEQEPGRFVHRRIVMAGIGPALRGSRGRAIPRCTRSGVARGLSESVRPAPAPPPGGRASRAAPRCQPVCARGQP